MKRTFIKYLVLVAFLISGCSADLMTKEIAKKEFKDHATVVIENTFDLRYVENHAIAFGFLGFIKNKNIRIPIIFILTISATFLAFLMIWKIRDKRFRLLVPFFILIGGAYGNIIDRMLNGFVTDFLHFHYQYKYNFPVFNLADILINIGLILIILQWKDFKPIFDSLFENKKDLVIEK
jgi:signal peptidase II